VDYVDEMGQPKNYWDWRFYCQEYTLHNLQNVHMVTRDSIWEISTVMKGINNHVFNIAFAAVHYQGHSVILTCVDRDLVSQVVLRLYLRSRIQVFQ